MRYWGSFQSMHTSHAQNLTGETYLSLGNNAVSGRCVFAEGGILTLVEGEIRNRDELLARLSLESTVSNAFLLLRLYGRWGADYVRRVEGSAVTAVIDRVEGRLILSRDRAGAVPAYYAWRGRSVAFAGRAEYLHRTGAAGHVIDADGLNALFCPSAPPAPGRTPFRDIRILEPGSVLISDARGIRTRRYSSLAPSDTEKPREEFMRILAENVTSIGEDCVFDAARFAPSAFAEPGRRVREDCALRPGIPIYADTETDSYGFSDLLRDSVFACGFPGDPMESIRILRLCTARTDTDNCVVSAAGGTEFLSPPAFVPAAPDAQSGISRFLKPVLRERLQPQKYIENRIHEMLDRIPVYTDEIPDIRDAQTNFALTALTLAPANAARWRHAASRAELRVRLPFLDERLISLLLCMSPPERSGLLSGLLTPPNGNLEPFRREIREEALLVARDSMQPIHRFVERSVFESEAEKPHSDLNALARLIQINDWFLQTDAEEDL